MPVTDPNVGLALALTFAAGAATAVGACVVFVPRLVKLASRRTLAAALALSAGVMTYVSFVEIMSLSLKKFHTAGYSDQLAYAYATLSFFGGVVFMMLLNFLVTYLLGGHHHHGHDGHDHLHHDGCGGEAGHRSSCKSGTRQNTQSSIVQDEGGGAAVGTTTAAGGEGFTPEEVDVGCPCCSDDPIGELERLQRMAEEMDLLEHQQQQQHHQANAKPQAEEEKQDLDSPLPADRQTTDDDDLEAGDRAPTGYDSDVVRADDSQLLMETEDGEAGKDGPSERDEARLKEQQKLLRMSVNTAVAIALHNFPEGLVTFLSTLADPKVGAVLCVAIAIHNIPEGICVAMPIYYATGNRWKAFGWAVLSGLSEPFAALLGWAVLATLFSDTLYAVMFGIVAGMMVIISVRELLPTAHRYDPEDSVVTYFFILGMTIMALSLVLFLI